MDRLVPMDVLISETDPATVTFELDCYWARKANADPTDYLKRHPGRFLSCHIKDMDENGDFIDYRIDVAGLRVSGYATPRRSEQFCSRLGAYQDLAK